MKFKFKVINGTQSGLNFSLGLNEYLGRSKKKNGLKDEKISSKHALIKKVGSRFLLVDNKSLNGLVVSGDKKEQVLLKKEQIFQLGDTLIEYLGVEGLSTPPSDRAKLFQFFEKLTLPNPTTATVELKLIPFFQPFKLRFIRGLQINSLWALAYGPRQVGKKTLEFNILEDLAPDICFTLTPKGDKIKFQTGSPKIVKINDVSTKSHFLENKDIISIYGTALQVEVDN